MGMDTTEKLLREMIENVSVRSVFQPIVDLFSGNVLGYEVLSRGIPPLEAPDDMFREAKRYNLTWDLERACRIAALRRIAEFPRPVSGSKFFINVSPDILSDPRFAEGFTMSQLEKYAIDPNQIVFEITEQHSIVDYGRFEKLVRHYMYQGFKIALDDFGSGHSGLITLIAAAPQYIKLDKEIIFNLHENASKQLLLKSVSALAGNLESQLIAEGVERWEDLEILSRLGIRYCQGFLLQRPQPEPGPIDEAVRDKIREISNRHNYTKSNLDVTVSNLVVKPKVQVDLAMPCEVVDEEFRKNPDLDHMVFVEKGRPIGLITRVYFYLKTGGPFGFALFQRKPARVLFKRESLVVNEKIRIDKLAKLVMGRTRENLYDPVMVTDSEGSFLGTVTMKRLLMRATDLEVQQAMGSNPLTNLPGNRVIQTWIQEAQAGGGFTVVYADLDRFKEYNDCYGFLMGDEMLRLTARVLRKALEGRDENIRLGHIGGDDFVVVASGKIPEAYLQEICENFDREKLVLFDPHTTQTGYYMAVNRDGREVSVPLVTLSLAAIESSKVGLNVHPGELGKIAASLKKKTKVLSAQNHHSTYLFERRGRRTGESGETVQSQHENAVASR